MRTTPIIDRLKAEATSLSGRVAGAAALARAMEMGSDWPVPHAFVVALSETADPNELLGDIAAQRVTQTFGVAVLVDNTSDEPGHTASDQIQDLFAEIMPALMGWAQDAGHQQFDYVSGELGEYDRARMWWEFVFQTVTEFEE